MGIIAAAASLNRSGQSIFDSIYRKLCYLTKNIQFNKAAGTAAIRPTGVRFDSAHHGLSARAERPTKRNALEAGQPRKRRINPGKAFLLRCRKAQSNFSALFLMDA